MSDCRHPEIEVDLVGGNGNAFAVLGAMLKALKKGNVPQEEIEEFKTQAMAGDYDYLLQTCMAWVTVN